MCGLFRKVFFGSGWGVLRMIIKTYGCPFSHDVGSCVGKEPTHHEWHHVDKNGETESSKIALYCDYSITGGFEDTLNDYKFLWLSESRAIAQKQNNFFKKHFDEFCGAYDLIFTHDRQYLYKSENVVYCPPASNLTWIKEPEIKNKSKLCSSICSGKEACVGHDIRNKTTRFLYENKYPVDLYGKFVNNPIEHKEEALNDYMFSITFENDRYDDYYTEKLMDCFATGTIPIYYGVPRVGEIFDIDGIIVVDENTDYNEIFDMITPEFYESKMGAIKKNYNKCINGILADDIIYNEVKKRREHATPTSI